MFDDTKVVFRMEEGHTIQWSKEKKRKKRTKGHAMIYTYKTRQ